MIDKRILTNMPRAIDRPYRPLVPGRVGFAPPRPAPVPGVNVSGRAQEEHALLVRPVNGAYQIIPGWHL